MVHTPVTPSARAMSVTRMLPLVLFLALSLLVSTSDAQVSETELEADVWSYIDSVQNPEGPCHEQPILVATDAPNKGFTAAMQDQLFCFFAALALNRTFVMQGHMGQYTKRAHKECHGKGHACFFKPLSRCHDGRLQTMVYADHTSDLMLPRARRQEPDVLRFDQAASDKEWDRVMITDTLLPAAHSNRGQFEGQSEAVDATEDMQGGQWVHRAFRRSAVSVASPAHATRLWRNPNRGGGVPSGSDPDSAGRGQRVLRVTYHSCRDLFDRNPEVYGPNYLMSRYIPPRFKHAVEALALPAWRAVGYRGPEMTRNPPEFPGAGIHWYHGLVQRWFLRPNVLVRSRMAKKKREMGWPKAQEGVQIAGIHVRRGDKQRELKYQLKFRDYFGFPVALRPHFANLTHVFVASDDPEVVKQATALCAGYGMTLLNQNLDLKQLGHQFQADSQSQFRASLGVIIDILLLAQSNMLVGTCSSGISRAASAMMLSVPGRVVYPPVRMDPEYGRRDAYNPCTNSYLWVQPDYLRLPLEGKVPKVSARGKDKGKGKGKQNKKKKKKKNKKKKKKKKEKDKKKGKNKGKKKQKAKRAADKKANGGKKQQQQQQQRQKGDQFRFQYMKPEL